MKERQEFLLIGAGRIGKRHAEQIARVGNLLAICDADLKRAEELAAVYTAKAYCNFDEMLKNEKGASIISICTPNGFHAEHSIKAMQAGLDVLCEKPLCITGTAGWQIMETAKYTQRRLFLVKSARYNKALQHLKKWISSGASGKIYSFHLSCIWNRPKEYYLNNWHGSLFPDGGTLYTQFSHYIDAIIWLLGEVEHVSGFRKNMAHQHVIEFEDEGTAALQMKSGAIGSMHWSVNSYSKNMEISLTIIAENGTVRVNGNYLDHLVYADCNSPYFEAFKNELADYSSVKSNHAAVYDHLMEAQASHMHSFPGIMDGIRTTETIERIYKTINIS